MEMTGVTVRRSSLGGFEAELRGDFVMGDGGHFITVTGWGNTEERARRELASALRHVDFETEKSPER